MPREHRTTGSAASAPAGRPTAQPRNEHQHEVSPTATGHWVRREIDQARNARDRATPPSTRPAAPSGAPPSGRGFVASVKFARRALLPPIVRCVRPAALQPSGAAASRPAGTPSISDVDGRYRFFARASGRRTCVRRLPGLRGLRSMIASPPVRVRSFAIISLSDASWCRQGSRCWNPCRRLGRGGAITPRTMSSMNVWSRLAEPSPAQGDGPGRGGVRCPAAARGREQGPRRPPSGSSIPDAAPGTADRQVRPLANIVDRDRRRRRHSSMPSARAR